MADLSDFHPLMQDALRTGRIPTDEDIARALGKEATEIATARELLESETEHPDAHRFRDRYHRLVAEMTAEWLERNPFAGNSIPAAELERIKDYCNQQIQHEWRQHVRRLKGELDDDE